MQKKLCVSALLFSITAFAAPVYFLVDQTQIPQYVVKPADPDCEKIRTHIPPGRTAQAEALAYAIADTLGLAYLTPETHLVRIPLDGAQKLCSIQRYIPDMENLCDLAQEWLKQNLSDEELLPLIDQSNFEQLFLFILLLYDTDAHANNIYARQDSCGVYHLIKIDNGLSFPDKNRQLFNALCLLPQAKNKFSQPIIELIENLPMERLYEQFLHFDMQNSYRAFEERTALLKQLAPDYSMREIDLIFRKEERQPPRQ